ncbi:MAG: Rad52/Rad22 family DNA repair protein [Candidatus Sericytochromatia bacterium]
MPQSSLQALKQEIPYRWKVQSARSSGCECVAYIDARQVMDLLDEVLGPENWQDHYREVAGKVYCDISIRIDGEWITKSDCCETGIDGEKGQASESFKWAAVKWGIGRFLYSLEPVRLKAVEAGQDPLGNPRFAPADDKGRRIYHLTAYIHALKKQNGQATAEQKDVLKRLCQELGWSSEQLRFQLQRYQTSWKELTQAQAARLIDELEAMGLTELEAV